MRAILFGLAVGAVMAHCGYLNFATRKLSAKVSRRVELSQAFTRSASPEECTVVYGQVTSSRECAVPLCVAAVARPPAKSEIVDTYLLNGPGYFSLLLPSGDYVLAAFADADGDSTFERDECVGSAGPDGTIHVPDPDSGGNVLPGIDIAVTCDSPTTSDAPDRIAMLSSEELVESAYYPSGAIRSLDDEIFSRKYGTLGMHDPAAFLERAGLYFYTLGERDMRKTPVVFVHGMGATPRSWRAVVEGIDRDRFDPWLFYYPSGQDLTKIADVFYEIFFSGNIIDLRRRKLGICAHSMGGLVVRAAVNRCSQESPGRFLKVIVSLCAPYGGSDAAATGIRNFSIVVPSWRQIATGSAFIESLHETPLPAHTRFYLLFGYHDIAAVKTGPNSDGTIPLRSQLYPPAQESATRVCGFDETHSSILRSETVIAKINEILTEEL